MIEKDDWRLTAGPVLGHKEKAQECSIVLHTISTAFGKLGS